MTKDEIMEMAYKAGIQEAFSLQHDQVLVQFQNGSLERFAALVEAKASEKERTAEREACAKLCDAEMFRETQNPDKAEVEGVRLGARFCAGYIRARSSEH